MNSKLIAGSALAAIAFGVNDRLPIDHQIPADIEIPTGVEVSDVTEALGDVVEVSKEKAGEVIEAAGEILDDVRATAAKETFALYNQLHSGLENALGDAEAKDLLELLVEAFEPVTKELQAAFYEGEGDW